jgi:uncharacterized membrane protein (UPF0127 family)
MKKFNVKFDVKRFTFVVFTCAIAVWIILQSPQILNGKEILEFNRDLKNYNVKLQILDQKQKQVAEFMVAIADDDYKKMYGLMNLNHLPKENGMLFPFFTSQVITMWMKNTRIPLDMLFIDSDDKIANIKTNAEPYSLEIISSKVEVKKVLEINANLVEKFHIKVGQSIKLSEEK